MTDRERPMDERRFDLLLGSWLSEGPSTAPDRIAQRALLEVATTPQAGTRLSAMWASMSAAPLAWAAVILTITIGLGIALGSQLVGDEPSPSASPSGTESPSATPAPTAAALETVTFAQGGFTVYLPSGWHSRATEGRTDAVVTGPGGGIRVRISDENGEILKCVGLAGCQPVPAASVADLIAIVTGEYVTEWGITASPQVTEAPVTLDGVEATRLTVQPPRGMSGPGTHRYVLLIRDSKALILEWVPRFSGVELWERIVDSLQFTEPRSAFRTVAGAGVEVRVPMDLVTSGSASRLTIRMPLDGTTLEFWAGTADGSCGICGRTNLDAPDDVISIMRSRAIQGSATSGVPHGGVTDGSRSYGGVQFSFASFLDQSRNPWRRSTYWLTFRPDGSPLLVAREEAPEGLIVGMEPAVVKDILATLRFIDGPIETSAAD